MDFDEGMSLDMAEGKYAKERLYLAMLDRGLGHNQGFELRQQCIHLAKRIPNKGNMCGCHLEKTCRQYSVQTLGGPPLLCHLQVP